MCSARLLLALVSALASPAAAEPGFELVHAATRHDALFDLAIHGPRAVAVGGHGLILTSDDAGRSWQTRPSPADEALLGIAMTADGQGLIVGQAGVVLRTTEHGARWSRVTSPSAARLFSVGLDSGGFALAVGAFGTLLASADHGASWHAAAPDWELFLGSPDAPHLYDVLLLDARTALVAGEFGLLLRTDDAGANWSLLRQGERSLFTLRATPADDLWALGQAGLLLRSRDRGQAWQEVDPGGEIELLDLALRPDGRGLLVGLNDLLITDDGGVSWVRQRPRLPLAWHQPVALTSSGDFLLAGAHGAIVRIDGNHHPLAYQGSSATGRGGG